MYRSMYRTVGLHVPIGGLSHGAMDSNWQAAGWPSQAAHWTLLQEGWMSRAIIAEDFENSNRGILATDVSRTLGVNITPFFMVEFFMA